MAARAHSVDPRAERVRIRLRDAAFALAHERRVDEITVGDIVARAEVSRQVFYQHFRDRDDAVATAFTVAFAAATADMDCLDGTTCDARARILRLFDFAAEHRSMYRNIVTQRVVSAFRAELQPACGQIARQGMPVVSPIASLTPESVTRFLVGGFMEVLRSWMEDPDSTDLSGRVGAALDTVNALLGLTTHSSLTTHSKGSHHG
jgi:AcrR family transcriptional regulator